MTSSFIAWEGESLLGSGRVAVLVTGLQRESKNRKTGPMVQVWILPVSGHRSAQDIHSVCGTCPRQPTSLGDGSCYAWAVRAVPSVLRSAGSNVTPRRSLSEGAALLAGRKVRIGALGDPAAVPAHVWETLLSRSAGWTGYTHAWTQAPELRRWLMASVDSEAEQRRAERNGWRTFRVRTPGERLTSREITCPASDEAGHRTTCERCQLCKGASSQARSIAIVDHGPGAKRRLNVIAA
jgi:hypothetical protein